MSTSSVGKIKCDICKINIKNSKFKSHIESEAHKIKYMTSLVSERMRQGSFVDNKGTDFSHEFVNEDYTVVEVDQHDPRFNSSSAHSLDDSSDGEYRNRVYTYDEIIKFFENKIPPKMPIV